MKHLFLPDLLGVLGVPGPGGAVAEVLVSGDAAALQPHHHHRPHQAHQPALQQHIRAQYCGPPITGHLATILIVWTNQRRVFRPAVHQSQLTWPSSASVSAPVSVNISRLAVARLARRLYTGPRTTGSTIRNVSWAAHTTSRGAKYCKHSVLLETYLEPFLEM